MDLAQDRPNGTRRPIERRRAIGHSVPQYEPQARPDVGGPSQGPLHRNPAAVVRRGSTVEVERIPLRLPGLARPVPLYRRVIHHYPPGPLHRAFAPPSDRDVYDREWQPRRVGLQVAPARTPAVSASASRSRSKAWWLLLPVLALQALAALRLVWYRGAYIDEATYAYAGSQELAHWIHGIAVSNFQSWMSGAPVVYPPLAAIASGIGGLTGDRLLSLAFMLGATVLLYATGSRLFGRSAGLLGTALFASLGATQFLSALATYDAMALCSLAGAVYLVVRWAGRLDMPAAIYSGVAAPVLLALADAAKYAAALWDPFVVGLVVVVSVMAGRSWRHALAKGVRFGIVLACLIAALLAIGKAKYVGAIFGSTVTRSAQNPGMGQAAAEVVHVGLVYGGLPIAVAVAGALLLGMPGRGAPPKPRAPYVLAGWTFVLASVAPVLAQVRIGTSVSLDKHVAFGAWFGCALGGYALARLLRYRVLHVACGLVLVTVLLAYGSSQAQGLDNWPTINSAFVAGLKKVVRPSSACKIGAAACQPEYLVVGQVYIPAYYVGPSVTSMQWKETFHFTYQAPHSHVVLTGPGAIDGAIRDRAFAAIIVEPNAIDEPETLAAIERYGGYRLDTLLPAPFLGGGSQPCQIWTRYGRVTSAP